MADDDTPRPVPRKIAEGVSGLPDPGPRPTPRPIKSDPDDPRFGTGNYWVQKGRNYAEGGAVKPNYDRFASDPARWSKTGRMGFDPEEPAPPTIKGEDYPKKGSYTVPKMCAGGKVIKTWSK